VKRNEQGLKVVTRVKPKQRYSHARAGDIINVVLDKERKQIKKGKYTARVKTPTKTGVEVKINGHRITSKLFNFLHRNDGLTLLNGQTDRQP
jgi:hypothetical protein